MPYALRLSEWDGTELSPCPRGKTKSWQINMIAEARDGMPIILE